MSNNAEWKVEGVEKATGNKLFEYVMSPDLSNHKEAVKRAAAKAKAKWARHGVVATVVGVHCVG